MAKDNDKGKDKNRGGGAPPAGDKRSVGGSSAPDSTRDLRGVAQVARLVGTGQGVKGMLLGLGFIALAILGSCIKSYIPPGGGASGGEPERLGPPTKTVELQVPLSTKREWVGDPADGDWIQIPAGSISWEVQNPQNEKGENEGLNILFWDGTIVTRESNGRATIRYKDGRVEVKPLGSKALWLDGLHQNKFKLAPYSMKGGGVAIVRWTFYVRE